MDIRLQLATTNPQNRVSPFVSGVELEQYINAPVVVKILRDTIIQTGQLVNTVYLAFQIFATTAVNHTPGIKGRKSLTRCLTKENDAYGFHVIKQICTRFHLVARQLRKRHDDRSTLDISDEYDVQDLLHSLLCLFFDDIRSEEGTPSYAGQSSRMDFLLKNESIVIEVKKTRQGLGGKRGWK